MSKFTADYVYEDAKHPDLGDDQRVTLAIKIDGIAKGEKLHHLCNAPLGSQICARIAEFVSSAKSEEITITTRSFKKSILAEARRLKAKQVYCGAIHDVGQSLRGEELTFYFK